MQTLYLLWVELLAAALLALGVCSPQATPAGGAGASPQTPQVIIGETAFSVEVADTAQKRTRGLSGRDSLPRDAGMLFIFPSGRASAFWMKGMRFPLDFVWIGAHCRVVDLTLEVPAPAPGTPDGQLPVYRSSAPAAYTLEVNAGEVSRRGITVGDPVRFVGVAVGGENPCP